MKHNNYTKLSDRLKVCNEYERHMHRNYDINGWNWHAILICFMQSGRAYVVLSSNAVHKDRLVISLKEFDEVLRREQENGKTV